LALIKNGEAAVYIEETNENSYWRADRRTIVQEERAMNPKTCNACGRPFDMNEEGAVIDGVLYCGGCQRDYEEVAEDASANPYEEVER
jgi:hypothetical protein